MNQDSSEKRPHWSAYVFIVTVSVDRYICNVGVDQYRCQLMATNSQERLTFL